MTDDVTEAGRAAWQRIRTNENLDDWLRVGRALIAGRNECMLQAGVNTTQSPKYRRVAKQWIKDRGFAGITGQERTYAVDMAENWRIIAPWLETLPAEERRRLHCPQAVCREWKAAKAPPAIVMDILPRLRQARERAPENLIRYVWSRSAAKRHDLPKINADLLIWATEAAQSVLDWQEAQQQPPKVKPRESHPAPSTGASIAIETASRAPV
jgi:hypothetical protein